MLKRGPAFPARRRRGRHAVLALAPLLTLALADAGEAAVPPANHVTGSELRRDRRMAEQLYRATSSDAANFTKALHDPALRRQLEGVFKKKLPDRTLHAMAAQAHAEALYWSRYRRGIDAQIGAESPQEAGRLIPGRLPPPSAVAPIVNPGALPPPRPFVTGGYMPVPDRWRILDALGRKENPLDPYNTNTLKGDKPVFGSDWFINVGAVSDTLYEPARVPTGIGAQYTARPAENNTFGRYGRTLVTETDILSLSLIKGDTTFKPPDFELRITPVFNFNHAEAGEVGVLNVNPAKGQSRNDSFVGLQEAFIDYHIRNVSEYYDFDSVRVGIQPFNTDFRGFLFQDNEPGIRFFGNRDANRWQYNLAFFQRLEKDTNSQLNDLGKQVRRDRVLVANIYRQDFPVHGFTSQLTYVRNDNDEGKEFYYDNNGFLVRPAQIGDDRGYDYNVNYFGFNGDGHFGRINLTTSAYWALGHLSHNQFGLAGNNGADIGAFFVAAEPSIDFNWARFRLSGLYQSGERHPQGGHAGGFDAISENPQFAGADSSFWIRQSIPLIGGGGVALTTENGILDDLRAAKGEGQSNFINPGLVLAGVGADFDILPELRLSTNANYLRFATTAPLEFLRHQAFIPDEIGYDLSAALTYRPLDTNNVVLRLSGGILVPGDGLKALYNTPGGSGLFINGGTLYSVLANVILTY